MPQTSAEAVRRLLPDDEVLDVRDEPELAVCRAEVGLGSIQPDQVRQMLDTVKELRWYHTGANGVEPIVGLFRGRDVILTNNRTAYAAPVAEHVIACVLAISKRLHLYRDRQRARRWLRDLQHDEVRGARMLVYGLGSIGGEIARLATALGMKVTGVRRSGAGGPRPGVVERIIPADELGAAAAETDYLIVAAPWTAQTEGAISREVIGRMRPTAWVINVARGRLVDEQALVEALQAKRIGGAALDVFETEPLPSSSPLWSLENVILTPHRSSHTSHMELRTLEGFVENVRRWKSGQPLLHRVDLGAGY